jgi:release factor glutamine methyltransferase
VLAAFVLGVPRSGLLGAAMTEQQRDRFDALVGRRAAREPLQHLTGEAPFRHLVLAVGPGVFVPRPETEGLVDLVLADCGPGRVAVDLCAGSGAIAASIAAEAPGTDVHAVEISPQALTWLRRNASGLIVHEADVTGFAGVRADVVVSNPPYLPTGLDVDPEVAADPPLALWGGADGLALMPEVIETAARLLAPGGLVAIEHDVSHQPAVLERLRDRGFEDVRGHRDLTGRDRYATGRKMQQ